jgi:hypothetical protein
VRGVHASHHVTLPADINLPTLLELLKSTPSHQKKLTRDGRRMGVVAECFNWLLVKEMTDEFDRTNATNSNVVRREAARLVSYSQPGGGAFIRQLPDRSVRHSVNTTPIMITMCQRLLGLYLSLLKAGLDAAAARGEIVTQAEFLGDAIINGTNKSHRHQLALRATYGALSAVTTAGSPEGTLKLGDRGDGTPEGKALALMRTAHLNAGTVPDIFRLGSPPHLFELKAYTFAHKDGLVGLRGAPSTTEGADIAFGNTAEALGRKVIGVRQRGSPTDPHAFNRLTGNGYLAATTGHDYEDALNKRHGVTLFVAESSGALEPTFDKHLQCLGRVARMPGSHDATVYGVTRSSPKDYYSHHTTLISSAITVADALVVVEYAIFLDHRASAGWQGGTELSSR